jgi:hypothetical protein
MVESGMSGGGDPSDRSWSLCFVTGRPRSGTTVFRSLLASHPLCYSIGEAFNESDIRSFGHYLVHRATHEPSIVLPRRRVASFVDYLDQARAIAARDRPGSRIVVIDIKYDQMHLIHEAWWHLTGPPPLFSLIVKSGWKIIDLRRRDLVRLAVSNLVAMESGVYHSDALKAAPPQAARIRVDPEQLLATIRATERDYRVVSDHFHGYAGYLGLTYEDLFDESGRFAAPLLDRLATFLGIENRFDPQPKLRRILTEDILCYVENADELSAALAAAAPAGSLESDAKQRRQAPPPLAGGGWEEG